MIAQTKSRKFNGIEMELIDESSMIFSESPRLTESRQAYQLEAINYRLNGRKARVVTSGKLSSTFRKIMLFVEPLQ